MTTYQPRSCLASEHSHPELLSQSIVADSGYTKHIETTHRNKSKSCSACTTHMGEKVVSPRFDTKRKIGSFSDLIPLTPCSSVFFDLSNLYSRRAPTSVSIWHIV